MTVKTRITLFVAGAGFIASLFFSVIVFFELIEQPFEILDNLLKEEAYATTARFLKSQKRSPTALSGFAANTFYNYWIKVYDQATNRLLYQSELAQSVKLPSSAPGSGAIANAEAVPGETIHGQQNSRQMHFRIRTFIVTLEGRPFIVQIARPVDKLEEEIRELVLGILSALVFSTLTLIAISRLVAAKILKPIGTMKDLAQDISEKNLDRRIPTGDEADEFNELAKTINRMLDRLQYSFTRQKNFLFDTSHELKTPLSTMRLAIDDICADDGESMPSDAKEKLLQLNHQVLRMERLVKDLLNLSSLETLTGIDPNPVELTEILASLAAEYRLLADANSISMDMRLPERLDVQGDAEKLYRAFSNVLDNALKYNVDGGRVEIIGNLSTAESTVAIRNTGPGVAAAELPRVFDQFYRAEKSRSLRYGGSGLGLAIVKRIVELHGGTVSFESQPGGLTQVTLRLPRHRGKIPAQ